MHLDGFAVLFSDGVKGSAAKLGEPLEFGQLVIVLGIDQCKLSASNGNSADGFGACFEGTAGVEIGALIVEKYAPPSADAALPLLTYKERPVRVYHPD